MIGRSGWCVARAYFYLFCLSRGNEQSRTNGISSSQITANGVAVAEALDLCRATVKPRAMYRCLERWRSRVHKAVEDKKVAELALVELQKGEVRGGARKSPNPPSPSSPGETASSFFAKQRKYPPRKRSRSSVTVLGDLLAKNTEVRKKVRTKAQDSAISQPRLRRASRP